MATTTAERPKTHNRKEQHYVPHGMEGLSPKNIEDLRALQHARIAEAMDEAAEDGKTNKKAQREAAQRAYQSFDGLNLNWLRDQGIAPDDPHRRLFEGYLRKYSVDAMSDDEWREPHNEANGIVLNGIEESDEIPSGRDRAQSDYEMIVVETHPNASPTTSSSDEYKPRRSAGYSDEQGTAPADSRKNSATPNADPGNPDGPENDGDRKISPEMAEANADLKVMRTKLAELTAKESGKPMTMRSRRYKKVLAEYNAQLVKAGQLREAFIDDEDGVDREPDVKNAETISYLLREQALLRKLTVEKFESTNVTKFIKWFNSGSRLERFGKGLALSLPFAAAAAISAPVGVAAAGIGAGVIATRFARMYSRGDKHRGTKLANEADEGLVASAFTDAGEGNGIQAAVAHMGEQYKLDKKSEQKLRRKAVAWGVGGIALGAGAGALVDFGMEASAGTAQRLVEKTADIHSSQTTGSETFRPVETTSSPHAKAGGVAGTGSGSGDTLSNNYEYSNGARTISSGEGWYKTFGQLDIPAKYNSQLLEDVGPKLGKMEFSDGTPIAYFDDSANEWRMNMSDSGKMPRKALDLISSTAQENGYINVADADASATGSTGGPNGEVPTAKMSETFTPVTSQESFAPGTSQESFAAEAGGGDGGDGGGDSGQTGEASQFSGRGGRGVYTGEGGVVGGGDIDQAVEGSDIIDKNGALGKYMKEIDVDEKYWGSGPAQQELIQALSYLHYGNGQPIASKTDMWRMNEYPGFELTDAAKKAIKRVVSRNHWTEAA